MIEVRDKDGQVWLIGFRYPRGRSISRRRNTECWLYRGGEVRAEGGAFLAPLDRFRAETGRKLALARALAQLDLDGDGRRPFWRAYLARTPHRHEWPDVQFGGVPTCRTCGYSRKSGGLLFVAPAKGA